jgi:peroxiredoxin Q/BCP
MGRRKPQYQDGGSMLKVGDLAPDFALPDQSGKMITLSYWKGKSHLVLFFYPKDHSPGCTMESCSFRDNYSAFQAEGAQIIGISTDSSASHKIFADTHHLPYPLLSDVKGLVSKQYGVKKTFGFLPGRASFVVDHNGIVRHALSSQFQIQRHVDETLKEVKKLNART